MVERTIDIDSRAATTHTRTERVLHAATNSGILRGEHRIAAFIDVDAVLATVTALKEAFVGVDVLHAFAVKACPLVPVLRLLGEAGLGCEVASPGELAQALAAGLAPERIVLDSPAKTEGELRWALELGVAINADSLMELDRIEALRGDSRSTIGLRINPQVGSGAIDAMSTASATSKFGVPLTDIGMRERVLQSFAARPWLTRLHVHVGSQGCPLDLIAAGIRSIYELAEEVNTRSEFQQVKTLDIGGGLPVNFDDARVTPTFAEFVAAVKVAVPELFDGRYRLVTEFGRSLLAKNGFTATRVEYTKVVANSRVVLTHAGANVATRTIFMPESWPLRLSAYDSGGYSKQGPMVSQSVAGPCCFAGDVIARDRLLPELARDDLVVLHDTGAYYFSSPWSYNSLARPPVYAFSTTAASLRFATVRTGQTIAEVVRESGSEHVDALTSLVSQVAAASSSRLGKGVVV